MAERERRFRAKSKTKEEGGSRVVSENLFDLARRNKQSVVKDILNTPCTTKRNDDVRKVSFPPKFS